MRRGVRETVRGLVGVLAACAVMGCAGRGGASTPAKAADAAPESADRPPLQAFGERCVGQPSKSLDALIVACDGDAMVFVAPGMDWTIEASPSPSVVVFASSGPLSLSVRVAEEAESQYDEHEHLEAVYRGVSSSLAEKGHQVSAPVFEQAQTGAVVLRYEIAVADGEDALRMVNAWRAVRGRDGRYLDYHVSFAASPDDPAWESSGKGAGPVEHVVDLAGAFFGPSRR